MSVATNGRESESGEGVIASGAETPVEGEGGVPELRDVRELTPIQVSYLRGREPGQPYGGVDCLALFEFRRELGEGRPGVAKSCPLDPEALCRAVASLKRHPVMRSVIVDGSHWSTRSNGDDSLPLTISIDDRPNVDGLAENGRNAAVNIDNICREKRSEILLRRADYATGELGWIDIGYVGTCEVTHIAVSLVAADLGGVGVIVNDLAAAYAAYAGAGRITADGDLAPDWRTFGAIAEREREYERDRAKNARNATKTDGDALDTTVADALPLPPALPAPGNGGGADGVGRSVTRHSGALGIPQWERLGRIAEAAGASRPGLLLAIYRHALGLWDPAERLSIVMPGMDKRATPDDVLDRTRAWITRCATSPGITLGEAARGATEEVRRRIRAGLDSDDELRQARSRGDDHPGILPVVLTCGSEEVLLSPEVGDVFGHLAHTGSVTPQVLCDLQVLRLTADEVRVALDVRDGAYAGTVGEELFSAFFGALRSLAEAAPDTDAAALAALPLDDVIRVAGDTAARRRALNGTAAAPDALLHAPFLERVEQAPDATAVIDPGNGDPSPTPSCTGRPWRWPMNSPTPSNRVISWESGCPRAAIRSPPCSPFCTSGRRTFRSARTPRWQQRPHTRDGRLTDPLGDVAREWGSSDRVPEAETWGAVVDAVWPEAVRSAAAMLTGDGARARGMLEHNRRCLCVLRWWQDVSAQLPAPERIDSRDSAHIDPPEVKS